MLRSEVFVYKTDTESKNIDKTTETLSDDDEELDSQ